MLIELAVIAIFLGVALIIIGIIISMIYPVRGRGETRGAGVIIIGPIPILVASDKEAAKIAVVLTAIALLFFTLFLVLIYGGV